MDSVLELFSRSYANEGTAAMNQTPQTYKQTDKRIVSRMLVNSVADGA